jgi:prefoldin subunit 5
MKWLYTLLFSFLVSAYLLAAPGQDTIKIMAGNQQILIITNRKSDQIKNLQRGSEQFKLKINQFQKKIDSLQKEIDSLSTLMDTVQNDSLKKIFKNEIQNWQNDIQNYRKFIAALKKGILDIQKQIQELNKQLESQESKDSIKILKRKRLLRKRKFIAHWSGLEIGLNSFFDQNYNPIIFDDNNLFKPNLGSSINVNFNFFEQKLPLTKFCGFVTGLSFSWLNYKYQDFPYYNISTKMFYPDSLHSQFDQTGKIQKIVLKNFSFRIPLLFEIQIPFGANPKNLFYINAGAFGSINISSKVKYVYTVNNNKIKVKDNIYSLTYPLSYGITGRIGIGRLQFYSDVYLVPLLKTADNYPIIYPVTFGFHFDF